MSKSVGNVILLTEEPEIVRKKIRSAFTDPQKIRLGDPGRPEICLVYTYHTKFNHKEYREIASGCRHGSLGCVECKTKLSEKIIDFLEPFRKNRAYYIEHIDEVKDILLDGERRGREVTTKTMDDVHKAMKLG